MHRLLLYAFLLLSFSLTGQQGFTVAEVPNPKESGNGYVSDPKNLLPPETVQQLNAILAELEQQSTAQVAVAVLPSIGEEVPKDFAVELFEEWGIGQADVDNGLLILTVEDQRRTEIEVGYGLEGLIPDVIAYRILLEEFVPRARDGDLGGAHVETVRRIADILQNPEALEEIRSAMEPAREWPMAFGLHIPPVIYYYGVACLIFGLLVSAWVIITLFNKEELYDKYRHVRYATSWIFLLLFPLPYLILYLLFRATLHRLRNQPRYSKINGLPMRKLDEEEEDAFLEAGQVKEESLRSIDYDVWVTDDGSDVVILPYSRRFSKYTNCPECRFRAYLPDQGHVIKKATYSRSGKMELVSECKNCNYRTSRIVSIPKKSRSSGGGGFGGGGGGGGSFGGGSSGGGGAGASW